MTPDSADRLRRRNPVQAGRQLGQFVRSARARHARLWWQVEGRAAAAALDPVHAAAAMLFWVEGSKQRNAVQLSNSDPELVAFFVGFLKQYFGVPPDRFRVWCNLFADHAERQPEIEQFWLDTLDLPRRCLAKSTVNYYSRATKKKRLNVLPYGTCRVSVYSTRIAQHLYGAIQEYAHFDRPEWQE